ncbi:MAG: PrgI family protein, partial [Patescibacteria group bacterium]
MDQHPIPRQITTFEFKLIGFMTLKQFIYLIVFLPIAYIVLSLFPIPILNILIAALVAFVGIALAFIPINDRPLDVYIKNFVKRVLMPTQFYYQKTGAYQNTNSTVQPTTQKQVNAHTEVNNKLNQYLSKTKTAQSTAILKDIKRKEEIKTALDLPLPSNLKLSTNNVPQQTPAP